MKKKSLLLIIPAVFLLGILISYAVAILKDEKIDQQVRNSAESSGFIELSDGFIEYELSGPESGEPVILVSGFSAPYFCWDKIYYKLTGAGYRVLRYNHYGRGLSDHVKAKYNPALFERELSELVEALDIEKPFTLFGLSMGGAVSVYYTNRHPEQVKRIALVSPAGFPTESITYLGFLAVPVIGDYFMTVFGDFFIRSSMIGNLMPTEAHSEFMDKFLSYYKYRGRTAALLSTMRHMPLGDMAEEYNNLPADIPVLLFWGKEDNVISFSNSELVLKAVPWAEFHPVAGAGHNLQYERPELVLRHFLEFMAE